MKLRHLALTASMLTALASAPVYAHGKMLSAQEFVTKASVGNEFEIESSQLALDRSHSDAVKSFAQHMVDDHSDTATKLSDVLDHSASHAQPAEGLDDKHQKMLSKLESAPDAAFDRQYIAMQSDAHNEAIGLFGNYAKNGHDAALKQFAGDTLPTLKKHKAHLDHLKAE